MSTKFQITVPDPLAHELNRGGKSADPFAGVTGLVDAEETDLAARVDQALYR